MLPPLSSLAGTRVQSVFLSLETEPGHKSVAAFCLTQFSLGGAGVGPVLHCLRLE